MMKFRVNFILLTFIFMSGCASNFLSEKNLQDLVKNKVITNNSETKQLFFLTNNRALSYNSKTKKTKKKSWYIKKSSSRAMLCLTDFTSIKDFQFAYCNRLTQNVDNHYFFFQVKCDLKNSKEIEEVSCDWANRETLPGSMYIYNKSKFIQKLKK